MTDALDGGVDHLHTHPEIIRGMFKDPDLAYITDADNAAHTKSTTRIRAY